jgi:predicted flap endonuclease-1-like 5' DNA nuclease
MNTLVAFILGLLVGWLIEWVIDWFYWRRRHGQEARDLRRRVFMLENDHADREAREAVLFAQVRDLQDARQSQDAEAASLKTQIEILEADKSAVLYRLQTAQSERQRLEQELDLCHVECRTLQDQIQVLTNETLDLSTRLANFTAPVSEFDDFTSLPEIDPDLSSHLHAAGIHKLNELAKLSPRQLHQTLGWSEEDSRAINILLSARAAVGLPSRLDNLELIKGIGPVIARLLRQAGIFTFAELGALDIEQLRHIVGEKIQRLADEADLLAQAQRLAKTG